MNKSKKSGSDSEKWLKELGDQAFERSIYTFILQAGPWGAMILGAAVAGLVFAFIYLFYLLYTW